MASNTILASQTDARPRRIPSHASMKFLAEAFAVWCDQKSRLTAARATGLVDEESHDALIAAYIRTRDLLGVLLARAEARRAASAIERSRAARAPIPDEPPGGPRAGSCSACG
jgi:hypothetical protein